MANQIRFEALPQTTEFFIDEWEKQYGIVPDPSWTLDQRRENLTNRRRYRAPMNPEVLSKLVSASIGGIDVDIEELTAYNTFTILIREYTDKLNRARQVVDRAKPAHLIYDMRIATITEADTALYYGLANNKKTVHSVEVMDYPKESIALYYGMANSKRTAHSVEVINYPKDSVALYSGAANIKRSTHITEVIS